MQIRKFLKEIHKLKPSIEELQESKLSISQQDNWEIDILEPEFDAYDGIYDQMVYCLDTIKLYYGLRQLRDLIEDGPEPYVIWGINDYTNFYYAYNFRNDEAVMLDNLLTPEPVMYCAASGGKLLDCLFVVAQYLKLKLLKCEIANDNKDEWIEKATLAAGGKKYKQFCEILINHII